MDLYKNGFVVVEMNNKDRSDIQWPLSKSSYLPWPLTEIMDDEIAQNLTEIADEVWFDRYHMQEIIPDAKYIKAYVAHCNDIGLDVKVLLFESTDNIIVTDDYYELLEVLGFDCIVGVYYSYLQTEYKQYPEMQAKDIFKNKYGLLDNIESIMEFISLRKQTLQNGGDIECSKELLVKISLVNIL